MALLRSLLEALHLRRPPQRGYGAEVLFAGWVELPKEIREIIARP